MDFTNKTVLIVGASGALGQEFCRQLSLRGARLIGTAQTNETAQNLNYCEQRLLLNLMDSNSIEAVANYLNENYQLNGVVNAAGLVAFGPAVELPLTSVEILNRVNFSGPVALLMRLKTNLEKASESFVLNVTGIVAQTPMPNMSHYSASKSAIHGFLSAVMREWRRSGIKVVSSLLGHTETGLSSRPISGVAPSLPTGLTPEQAVSEMIDSLG